MTTDTSSQHLELSISRLAPAQTRSGWARRVIGLTLLNLSILDVIILTFHAAIWLRISLAPAGPLRAQAWWFASGLLALAGATMLLCRGELLPPGTLRGIAYRLLTIACVLLSYFEMRTLLPALQPVLLDGALLAVDEALLGVTPAVWLERFVSPATTQWFSFFYYSYFWLLVLNVIGTAALDRDGRRRHELLLGATVVALTGHLLYTVVPGAGPCAHLTFSSPLPGVFWWRQVLAVVERAGALLDIFPSLHTALPAFFALHAFRQRQALPFRLIWPIAAFFSANIIVATLFLRWHYAVDVVAGLTLAAAAQRFAVAVARREQHRPALGLQPVFESLWPRRQRVDPHQTCGRAGPSRSS